MSIPPLLDELLRARGPSGFEEEVSAIVRREAASFGAEVEADALGSTVARIRGTDGGRVLAVAAHVDQVGVTVSHVFGDGLLGVTKLANWAASDAVGRRFEILAQGNTTVAAVAVRVGEGDVTWEQVRFDVGVSDGEAAAALVRVGDPAVLVSPPVELAGTRLAAAALDDRAGLYAALEALRRLAASPPSWDVALVASTQEEGGESSTGVSAVADRLRPDAALVVEVTYATDAAGHDPVEWGAHDLGDGVAVFRGGIVSRLVADRLIELAAAERIPHCIETGRVTWSDADEIAARAGGIATGMLSIPLRSMHTANEVVDLADVDAASRLVEAFARSLEPGTSFVR
jgi:endoglucanase